uniref:(northern house mosquito) hypothetical protein n=1 Tax=Culex pipiens TaxID=7175 RepID=A0A8D8ASU2_CULPI
MFYVRRPLGKLIRSTLGFVKRKIMAKETDVVREEFEIDTLELARWATVSSIGLMFVPSVVLTPICCFLSSVVFLSAATFSPWFLPITTGCILGPLVTQAFSSGLVGVGCGIWWMYEEEVRAQKYNN